MQSHSIDFDETFYESTSTEDESADLFLNLTALNSPTYQSQCHQIYNTHLFRNSIQPKLSLQNNVLSHRSSSSVDTEISPKKQHGTTFIEKPKYSNGEDGNQRIIRTKRKLRVRNGTPRIVRDFRRHSGTLRCEKISSLVQGEEKADDNCNVVPCQDSESNHPDNQLPSRSPKNQIRISQSQPTIFAVSSPLNRSSSPYKQSDNQLPKNNEYNDIGPESSLPHRLQCLATSARGHVPNNLNTVEDSPSCRTCNHELKKRTSEPTVQLPNALSQIECRTKIKIPPRAKSREKFGMAPNRIKCELTKGSSLIRDPDGTKVYGATTIDNRVTEINDAEFSGECTVISHRAKPPLDDASSSFAQLQTRQKFPRIETGNRSRIHSHKVAHHNTEMEPQQQLSNHQTTFHHFQSVNEVSLSSLGFNTEELIDWDNVDLPNKTDLYNKLKNRIRNYRNTDFIVKIGTEEFHCHLLVLQSYSTFFDKQNCREIELEQSNVTSKVFSIIYDWMISAAHESCRLFRRDNILDILMSAQYLGIEELRVLCHTLIENEKLYIEDTAFSMYLKAKKKGNKAVMDVMVPRIMNFFLLLVSTTDFLELSVDELCSLLRSNHICVNSEMDVFMSAIRWLMFDRSNRQKYVLKVLDCVRFNLIAPWQLIDVKKNAGNHEFVELVAFKEVQKMVDDGLAFAIIKYWYGDQTVDYYHWINLLGLTEPTNRKWTGDSNNYITYHEFLIYLDKYQRTIMPELRRSKSMSSNQQQCSKLQLSNEANDNCDNHATGTPTFDQIDMTIDGATVLAKFPNTTVESSLVETPSAPTHNRMSSEVVTEYSTGYKSCPKTNDCGDQPDNGREKIGNAQRNNHSPLNSIQELLQQNNYDNEDKQQFIDASNMHCDIELEQNIIIAHGEQQYSVGLNHAQPGDHTDSFITENNATTKIRTYYRGCYKMHKELTKQKQISPREDRNTKTFSELLLISINNDEFLAISEAIGTVDASNGGIVERRYRRGNSHTKQFASFGKRMNLNGNTNGGENIGNVDFCVEKFDQACTQKHSKHSCTSTEREILMGHLTQSKPSYMNNSTTLLYNFDGRLSSATPSDNNTDTDEPLSSIIQSETSKKYTSSERANSDTNDQTITYEIGKAENYFPDYSLFYSECEAVLVMGGIDLHSDYRICGNAGKDMYRYRPLENVWEFVGEIPEPRHHHSTVYLDGRVYLVGGADPRKDNNQERRPIVGTVWSYDPARRQWYREPDMLTARQNFSLVVIQKRIFAIGGQDRKGFALRSVEAFDPVEYKWRKIRPMDTPRVGAACANFQDCIWVTGGMKESEILSDVERYDPVSNIWHKIEPLRIPRCFATLCNSSNCLYLIGGVSQLSACDNMTESIKSVDVWDCNLRTWYQLTEMSIARHKHSMSTIGNQLLIIGGITTVHMKTLNSIECFCDEQSRWMKGVASLPHAISGHDSVSLPPLNIFEDV